MSDFIPFPIDAALRRHPPAKDANPAKPEEKLAALAGLAGAPTSKLLKDHLYDFLARRIEVIHLKTCTTPELFRASEGLMLEAFRAWASRRQLHFVTVDEFRAAMKELFNGPEFKFDDQRRAWVGFRYLK